MKRNFSWSPNVSNFGGIEAFSRRVVEARDADPEAELLLVQASQGIALKVRFQRQGFVCRYEFRNGQDSQLELVTASAVSMAGGWKYFAIRLDMISKSLRVGIALDQQRGYSMRCHQSGRVGGMMVSVHPEGMVKVPREALRSYSFDGRILCGWSLLTMVAFGRCSDRALEQSLRHEAKLKQHNLAMFEDLESGYGLRTGEGLTGIFLPSGRLDVINA
jgi:hypothetical protein